MKTSAKAGKNSYLRRKDDCDPDSAIRDAQARIDAEGSRTPFFRSPFFMVALAVATTAGVVGGLYWLDQRNTEYAISSCHEALDRMETGEAVLEHCRTAAAEGDQRSVEGLAAIWTGSGRSDLAFPHLKKCSEWNNAGCQFLLSGIYRDGIPGILDANPVTSQQLLLKSSGNGSPEASFAAYRAFLTGSEAYLLQEDQEKALEYLKKAADLGHPEALFLVSRYHRTGENGFPENYTRSTELLKESADRGYPEALGQYGLLLLEGDNDEKAVKYLKLGEEAGDPLSCTLMAEMYRSGKAVLPGESHEKTARIIELLKIGAESGNPMAIRSLIEIYREEEDSESYIHWIRRGLYMNLPEAYGYMGEALEDEYAIEAPLEATDQVGATIHEILQSQPGLETAVQYYRRGAAHQDTRSYGRLLKIYGRKEFAGKLNSEIFSLAQEYADLDPQKGLEILADCHARGIGTAADQKAALDLLARKITSYQDLPLAADTLRRLLTGTGGSRVSGIRRDPRFAPRFAALLLDLGAKGREEYLSLWREILNSGDADSRLALVSVINGIPPEHQEALSEDDSYLYLKLRTNLSAPKITRENLEAMRQTADMLLLREHLDTELFYADMAYSGTMLFAKPDYQTALRWYEEALPRMDHPDGTLLYRLGLICTEKAPEDQRDYQKGLEYFRAALKEDRDLALDMIISKYILAPKNTRATAILSNTEKYYYLKLAETIGRAGKQTTAAEQKIKKELKAEEISATEQSVYEEMVRRKALENSRRVAEDKKKEERAEPAIASSNGGKNSTGSSRQGKRKGK